MDNIRKCFERFKGLSLSQTTLETLENTNKELRNMFANKKPFKEMSQEMIDSVLLFYLYFEDLAPEFKDIKLDDFAKIIIPGNNFCTAFKNIFRNLRIVFLSLRKENEKFIKVHRSFGFHNLFFIQLFKMRHEFITEIAFKDSHRLWTFFVYLTRQNKSSNNLGEMLDIISSVVINFLSDKREEPNEDIIIKRIEKILHYSIENSAYLKYKHQIDSLLKEYKTGPFPLEEFKKSMLTDKERLDMDFMFFLETIKPNVQLTPCLSPITRNNKKILRFDGSNRRTHISTPYQNRINISNNFQDMVSLLKSPETQLCSPMLKKRFENKDNTMEFSRMYQWYKNIINNVILKEIPFNNIIHKMTDEFSKYARMPFVLDNFIETMKCLNTSSKTREFILKLFFKLLNQFIGKELNSSKLEEVQNLLKDIKFMKSVLCLAIELVTFITNENLDSYENIQNILKKCETSFVDFWKILYNFARFFGHELPSLLRSHIVGLEFEILLKWIWSMNEEESEVKNLFITENNANEIIIKRILNILAERLYLISFDCKINDDIKQQIWEMLKSVIFPDLFQPRTILIEADDEQLRHKIHLDWVLICCIFHLSKTNNLNIKFQQITDIYNKKVLFAGSNIDSDSWRYFNDIFNKKAIISPISELSNRKRASIFKKKEANSTPIRTNVSRRINKMINSPLLDNLNMNLEKRSPSQFQSANENRKDSVGSLRSAKLINFKKPIKESMPRINPHFKLSIPSSMGNLPSLSFTNNMNRNISVIQPSPSMNEFEVGDDDENDGNVTPGFN